MKVLFVLLALLTFTGCSKSTVVDNIADSVIQSVENIEKNLRNRIGNGTDKRCKSPDS